MTSAATHIVSIGGCTEDRHGGPDQPLRRSQEAEGLSALACTEARSSVGRHEGAARGLEGGAAGRRYTQRHGAQRKAGLPAVRTRAKAS